jgi:hypothetical protein
MAPELLQQPPPPPPSTPTTTTTTTCTPPYDARAADAWALGVLLYLLLAGAYPFEDERHPSSVAHTVANVLSGRRRAWPQWVSSEARRVVDGLLSPSPAARTTLRDLAVDPWLVGGAQKYARGVPGGPALVNLSAVACGGGAGGQQQQRREAAAVVVEGAVAAAPPSPAPAPAPTQQPEQPKPQQPKQGLLKRLMAGLRVK